MKVSRGRVIVKVGMGRVIVRVGRGKMGWARVGFG